MGKLNFMGAVLLLSALLGGCDSSKSNVFVGHWVEDNESPQAPMSLDITLSDNVFHIDEKKHLLGKTFERKLEGTALSDTTLSILGGALTMRFENERLYYNGREMVKAR